MTERRNVRIKVYGREYSIVSSAEPDATMEYAAFVDGVMRDIGLKTGATDPNRVAILALLHITHELFSLRAQLKADEDEYERRIDRLLADLTRPISAGGTQTELPADK